MLYKSSKRQQIWRCAKPNAINVAGGDISSSSVWWAEDLNLKGRGGDKWVSAHAPTFHDLINFDCPPICFYWTYKHSNWRREYWRLTAPILESLSQFGNPCLKPRLAFNKLPQSKLSTRIWPYLRSWAYLAKLCHYFCQKKLVCINLDFQNPKISVANHHSHRNTSLIRHPLVSESALYKGACRHGLVKHFHISTAQNPDFSLIAID